MKNFRCKTQILFFGTVLLGLGIACSPNPTRAEGATSTRPENYEPLVRFLSQPLYETKNRIPLQERSIDVFAFLPKLRQHLSETEFPEEAKPWLQETDRRLHRAGNKIAEYVKLNRKKASDLQVLSGAATLLLEEELPEDASFFQQLNQAGGFFEALMSVGQRFASELAMANLRQELRVLAHLIRESSGALPDAFRSDKPLAFAVDDGVLGLGASRNGNRLSKLVPGLPLNQAGLKDGDRLIEIDGKTVTAENGDLLDRANRTGKTFSGKVHRAGHTEPISFTVRKLRHAPLELDYDGTFRSIFARDELRIRNRHGRALNHCMVKVQLYNQTSNSFRSHVHFQQTWGKGKTLFAGYSQKNAFGTSATFGTTHFVLVDIVADELPYRVRQVIPYFGQELDRDVERYLSKLDVSLRSIPYVEGLVWDTNAGARIALSGVKVLPPTHVEIEFERPGRNEVRMRRKMTNFFDSSLFSPSGAYTFSAPSLNYGRISKYSVTLSWPDTATTKSFHFAR